MAKIQTLELDLPAFWACALINGDTSGFEPEDQAQLDLFEAYMVKTYGQCRAMNCGDESDDFRSIHDATMFGVLACNVLEYTFDITERGD